MKGALPYLIPAVSALVALASVWFTYLRTKPDVRKANAEASTIELDLLNDMRLEMSRLRDRVLKAEANAAKAEVARAQAQADLAMAMARASEERHDLKEQVYLLQGRNKILEDKVQTLTARLDERSGRRAEDP